MSYFNGLTIQEYKEAVECLSDHYQAVKVFVEERREESHGGYQCRHLSETVVSLDTVISRLSTLCSAVEADQAGSGTWTPATATAAENWYDYLLTHPTTMATYATDHTQINEVTDIPRWYGVYLYTGSVCKLLPYSMKVMDQVLYPEVVI